MFKIAIVIIAAVTISGALAVLGPSKNPGNAPVPPINPTAMMQQAKDLPVDPSYPAF